MDLKLTVDGLEKERDFYFSKLRDIELICQEHENENSPIITGIISVLYATEVRARHCCTYPPCPGTLILLFGLPRDETPLPHGCFQPLASFTPCGAQGGFGLCRSPCAVPGGDKAGATQADGHLCPLPCQEGFAPPEDDELEEQQPEDQDEY